MVSFIIGLALQGWGSHRSKRGVNCSFLGFTANQYQTMQALGLNEKWRGGDRDAGKRPGNVYTSIRAA